ncbi:selenoprotein W-related protein [Pedobacter sp. W3I1]|uniref:SelT/SelW/SelH family protein n=1 Tax=Pedobacter sp. W3I1 TaxID=3042291 RepID=UPI00277F8FF6|nr:Rdx family protein [Pedobacter sp. W3I1]MDQ0639815.1 selenoprotein W-related protein [Pedobacter sp. W3I1]
MEKALVNITYCPKCGWMLRSAYMAQEILTTFVDDVKGVTLIPSKTSGVFTVHVGEKLIFDRKQMQRFPEIKELKQLIRDEVNPNMNLGHSDVK